MAVAGEVGVGMASARRFCDEARRLCSVFVSDVVSRASYERRFVRCAAALLLVVLGGGVASGFTLFGYRTAADIQNGQYNRWVKQPARVPFTLTYKVDPNCLLNQSPAVAAEVKNAAVRALNSWSGTTNGFIRFQEETRWVGTVNNANPVPPRWEGPPVSEYLANQAYFQSLGLAPGWGANIEIFSKPTNWHIDSQSYPTFVMGGGNLAFTVVNRQSGNIVSVDIYLNDSQQWSVASGQPGFDVESAILHELGHALGLDHPNETPNYPGSVNLDAYTFASGAPWCECDVMYGGYTGIKRALTKDESGAMSFLYPCGAGDLSADGQITMVDMARAISVAESAGPPRPYDLRAMDFVDHNLAIGPAELAYELQWATGRIAYNPAGPPGALLSSSQVSPIGPGVKTFSTSTVTLSALASPTDIGKGGVVNVVVSIQNPNAIPTLGYGLNFVYDPAILSNPHCAPGAFPAGSLKIANLQNDGSLEISNIAAAEDSSLAGTLFTLTFDINLAAAASAGSAGFTLANPSVVVNIGGVIRNYGTMAGETLIVQNTSVIASDLDVNRNGVIDLVDLFAWHQAPIDVNHDLVINDADRQRLSDCLRRDEVADMLPVERLNP